MIHMVIRKANCQQLKLIRQKYSSSLIRSNFIDYFTQKYDHKFIKSSSVVPLHDPTVPFINAGMNQFKNILLGNAEASYPRVVNSQKCVRAKGKHNDLDVVGTDGHHHTFFEMLGNWSFGDFYKKEACKMAWELLLGPFQLTPDNLVVTYFSGDAILGLKEDSETRDIWKQIGVPSSRIIPKGASDNFWEMGVSGPCGPCTELHYVNPDGSLTEIWNIVFIQFNREADGSIRGLSKYHVDTGMGLERMTAILQGVSSNYDTDLFQPLIKAIEQKSNMAPYDGRFDSEATLARSYRQLTDHARMISICLADGVFPASSPILKQIMRKSFKISTDIFQNPHLLAHLYDLVCISLGPTYPELISKEREAKLIIYQELENYKIMTKNMKKKWKDLVKQYPEVEELGDFDIPGFASGYKELREVMSKSNSKLIPGEILYKLQNLGFSEEVVQLLAKKFNLELDKEGFNKIQTEHKVRVKKHLQELSENRGSKFEYAINELIKNNIKSTNEQPKYEYAVIDDRITFEPLNTYLVAILNEDIEWIDYLEPCDNRPYYLVTQDTNFYCEEGGQAADSGTIRINKKAIFNVDTVFKIRGFVFHKGYFKNACGYVKRGDVSMDIDSDKRLKLMRNHTANHLLNAAIREVLPNSVVCATGSKAIESGLSLTCALYGEKLSKQVIMDAQNLIRQSIAADSSVVTRIVDSARLSEESSILSIPGEHYPEIGLRLVHIAPPLESRELCCGTHVPSTRFIEHFCITLVKAPGSFMPTMHALTSSAAKQALDLFQRAYDLEKVKHLLDFERRKQEATEIKKSLTELCGTNGVPFGDYAKCINCLDMLLKETKKDDKILDLQSIAHAELLEAILEAERSGRMLCIHFLRCSYLMQRDDVTGALARQLQESGVSRMPVLILGCADGFLTAACYVPKEMINETFTAERWLKCILPVFDTKLLPPPSDSTSMHTYAEMTPVKVSLITCEQLVQDAMRVAIMFGQDHLKSRPTVTKQGEQMNKDDARIDSTGLK